jgi:nucleoid-associated protein YgaU
MASLTAHLRRPDDHGRLGFHPECPICRRERLSGAPPVDALVGPRNQALLAASVLALSTASPTASLATTDQETEGTAPPEQVANDPVQPAAAFDPGGHSTELPVDVAPAPEANAVPESSAETAPLEQEPVADEVVPVADAGDATGVEELAPAPAADSVPPPAADPVAPAPPPIPPVQDPPAATHQEPQVESSPPPPAAEESTRASEPEEAQPPAAAVAPAQPQGEPAAAPEAPAQLQAEPIAAPEGPRGSAPVPFVQAAHRAAAQPGDRVHVVQRGESLWSIAKDVLGDDASVARIAREVNRLWELNSERIGTGEPDLVMAGTRITLR